MRGEDYAKRSIAIQTPDRQQRPGPGQRGWEARTDKRVEVVIELETSQSKSEDDVDGSGVV